MMLKALRSKIYCRMDTARILAGVSSFVPLRQRYLFTRHNRLRLRYVLPSVTALGLLTIMTGTHIVSAALSGASPYDLASASEFESPPADQNPSDQYEAASRRMQRYAHYSDDSAGGRGEHLLTQVMAVLPAAGPPRPKEKAFEIGRGDTLAGLMQDAGISSSDAYNAVEALREYYNPRDMKPGQKVYLNFEPSESGGGAYSFSHMRVLLDPLKTVLLKKADDDTFRVSLEEKKVERKLHAQRATVENSLYGSALKADIPSAVIAETIRIYSWDIDFQRDIREGVQMEVMYESFETEDGTPVKTGEIIYARLNINGVDTPVYRFKTRDGDVDYFTPDGHSVRKALMSTPVDGARISSGFGMRRHPVLGYTKMHKGTDFAAPRGTPIYAAGDGTIERMGPYSSYGNYVRIRHNSGLKTAYGHMQKFAKGLSAGSRVKQGQVIGYIGQTGRATGPHLHYEVLLNNSQVNPRSVKMQQGDSLRGAQFKTFQAQVQQINQRYAALIGSGRFAALTQGRKASLLR